MMGEQRMRSAGAKDGDEGEGETMRSSYLTEQKGWWMEGESTFLSTVVCK